MKAKWGLFMTEQKKNTIITSGIAVLAVILSYCFRIVGRGSFYPMLFVPMLALLIAMSLGKPDKARSRWAA